MLKDVKSPPLVANAQGPSKVRGGRRLVAPVLLVLCAVYVARAAASGTLSPIGLGIVAVIIAATLYWRYQPPKRDADRLRQQIAARYFQAPDTGEVVINVLGSERHIPVAAEDLGAPLPLEQRIGPYAALALHMRHRDVPAAVQRMYDAYRSGYLEYLTVFTVVLSVWGAVDDVGVWYIVSSFTFIRFVYIPVRLGDQVVCEWKNVPWYDSSIEDVVERSYPEEGRAIQYSAVFITCMTLIYLHGVGYWAPLIEILS